MPKPPFDGNSSGPFPPDQGGRRPGQRPPPMSSSTRPQEVSGGPIRLTSHTVSAPLPAPAKPIEDDSVSFWKLLLTIVGAALAGVAFVYLLGMIPRDEPIAPDTALDPVSMIETPVWPDEKGFTESGFRSAFLQANGGAIRLSGINSMVVAGTYYAGKDEEGVSMKIYKKRPELVYMRLEGPAAILELGNSGKEVWSMLTNRSTQASFLIPLKPEQEISVRLLGRFFHPFTELCLTDQGEILEIRTAERKGVRFIEIVFTPASSKTPWTTLINDKLRIIENRFMNDQGKSVIVNYGDFRLVEELWMPFYADAYIENELSYRVQFADVRLNTGVVSLVFAKPEVTPQKAPEVPSPKER